MQLQQYITNELEPVFGKYDECIELHRQLLCGLECDPRQSEYVIANRFGYRL